MRPQLTSFRLLSFSASGTEANTDVAEHKVEVSAGLSFALTADESKPELRPAVFLKLDVTALIQRDGKSEPLAKIDAHYEGIFLFASGTDTKELLPVFSTPDYQRDLASQVYPLAIAHLRGQMGYMGFAVGNLPLGLPSISPVPANS